MFLRVSRPSRRRFFRGEKRLQANTEALLGPARGPRPGRIMVTLGVEAADDPYFITRLVQQGADVVRINCAHDDENVWAHMIAHARTAEQKLGRRICILMDIAGPKVRTLDVTTLRDRARLLVGDELLLRQEPALAYSGFSTGCTIPEIFGRLKLGDRVSLDDGKLRGRIIRQSEEGLVAEAIEVRALLPPLRARDARIFVNPGDLPAGSLRHLFELAALVLSRRLFAGAYPQIQGCSLGH